MSKYYDLDVLILNIANDFVEAYKRCVEGKNKKIDEFGRTAYSTANIPAIVNATFACELFIKSMLPPEQYGHDLKYLFNALDTAVQKELRDIIDPKLINLNWNKDFDGYLEDIANVFTFWRYIYEKDKMEGFLGNRINEYIAVFPVFLSALQDIAIRHKNKNLN